jgi:hypothetical protein
VVEGAVIFTVIICDIDEDGVVGTGFGGLMLTSVHVPTGELNVELMSNVAAGDPE